MRCSCPGGPKGALGIPLTDLSLLRLIVELLRRYELTTWLLWAGAASRCLYNDYQGVFLLGLQ